MKKMIDLFSDLQKMDPALAQALSNIRAGKSTPKDAEVLARGMYTDTMVPKMGNKLAYNDFLTRHGNAGTHVHVDMNDFGQINKHHGEKVGDHAIKNFGKVASEVSRMFGGKAFRNGGDEFKFHFAKPEAAHGFARELRSRLERLPKAGGTHNLAASIGIGHNPDHAEGALLEAKKQLGPTDVKTGKRQNIHSLGNAPTVIHSKSHEPTPPGWKPAKAKEVKPVKTFPAVQHPSLKFHNPLAKSGIQGMDILHPIPQQKPEHETLPAPTAHPHGYSWHDGHTEHHAEQVIIKKDELAAAPITKHPHTDGAIPNQPKPANDQAAGAGVATYAKFAAPYGKITPGKKTNLFHYDYRPHEGKLNDLLKEHKFEVYTAGGKFGKPDLASRNYNTGHLMIYDPTPSSGGDFGDESYTRTWRTAHELAHGLTYPELNAKYGEGRRIGKLGVHRTPREAKRAVEWEWMAAHKQREITEKLTGKPVPDELFHRELNTVMHDAVHRAVTGQFTEPSDEGFDPHTHKVPLEHALAMIDQEARTMGIPHDDSLAPKKGGR